VVTRLRAGRPRIWVLSASGAGIFFLLHNVQTVYWVHPSTYVFTEGTAVRSNAAGVWNLQEYRVSSHVFMALCLLQYIHFTLMLSQAKLKSPSGVPFKSIKTRRPKLRSNNSVCDWIYVNVTLRSSALSATTHLTEVQHCLPQHIWQKFCTICHITSDRSSALSAT
jgi:hypothetical protein